jgi:thiosulfate/3-mercaptopyruvate sulfurtransferase
MRHINLQNRQSGTEMTIFKNLISVAELNALLQEGSCRVVDCRHELMQPEKGYQEYLAGHIDGAVYANLDQDLASPISADSGRHPLPDITDFQAVVEAWGVSDDVQVVVYDNGNGAIAARLWWMLRWVGHANVAVLDGGITAWLGAGELTSVDIPIIDSMAYKLEPNSKMIVTTEEVAAAQESGDFTLLDARDKNRFDGVSEPIDSKAGHVPGALNVPFSKLLQSDGRWRPIDELVEIWRRSVTTTEGQSLVAMCGSGVTACHLLITAEMLGLPMPRLYVGSWSEWIRDESRAVATADDE